VHYYPPWANIYGDVIKHLLYLFHGQPTETSYLGKQIIILIDISLFYILCITAQVERYGPYTAVHGYFTDRITAVTSGAEIRPYHNEITVRIRLYTVKIQPRIQCRITVPKITRKYGPFTAPYEANLR
jgi:hypothetical protein